VNFLGIFLDLSQWIFSIFCRTPHGYIYGPFVVCLTLIILEFFQQLSVNFLNIFSVLCLCIISTFYQPTLGEFSSYSVGRLKVSILIAVLSLVLPQIISILCRKSQDEFSWYMVVRLTVNYVGIFLNFFGALWNFSWISYDEDDRSFLIRLTTNYFNIFGGIKYHTKYNILGGKFHVGLKPGLLVNFK
jgi:hypothetical protein